MLFHENLAHLSRTRPRQMFMEDHLGPLSCGEAREQIEAIADGLWHLGILPGQRIALLARNSTRLFLTFHAISLLGAVSVPLNFRLAPAEWAYIIKDSEAVAIIAESEFHVALHSALGSVVSCLSYEHGCAGWLQFDKWITTPRRTRHYRAAIDEPVYQMYTSGTTGRPKGVLITHGNYAANLSQVASVLSVRPKIGDRALVVTPLYHCAGVWICSFATLFGMSILLNRQFEVNAVVDDLEARGVHLTFLVPAMIQRILLECPGLKLRDWSRLQTLMYGASPIAEETLRRAVDVFGCDFYQAYGLTETTGILSILGPDEHRRGLAGESHLLLSAGKALPGTEIRITSVDKPCADVGEVGEICARGWQISKGYFRLSKETDTAMAEGWFHTGDAGDCDAEGNIYLRDRLKDMVVSGGENVYPREVENVLFLHPEVADAAVIGVPDVRYGETLLAFIVPREGAQLTEERVTAFCRQHLGGYKVPRRIEFRSELPRNASGKILKTELRAPFWVGRQRSVA